MSIVIPVYNRESLVLRCLDSVLSQTHRPLDVIVVDNNSTDSTVQKVKQWAEKNHDDKLNLKILTQPVPGASAARNLGLGHVRTDYTIFFDSDDEMHPALVSEALEAIGDAQLIYWKASIVDTNGKRHERPFHSDNLLMREFVNSQLSTQTYMARTELFRRVGGWNENAAVWNDWELGIRLALMSPSYVALPKELVTIHAQSDSITGRRFHDKKGEWEKTVEIVRGRLSESDAQKYLPILDYILTVLASHYRKEGFKASARSLMNTLLVGKSLFSNILLRVIYHYTARGGRGAYYLWLNCNPVFKRPIHKKF